MNPKPHAVVVDALKANPSDEAAKLAAELKWGDRMKFAGRVGGRILVVVALGQTGYEFLTAEHKTRVVAKEISGWVAGWYGAKLGAKGGTAIGLGIAVVGGQAGPQIAAPEEIVTVPIASSVGGIVGGMVGAIGGWFGGTTITERVYDWVFSKGFSATSR